MISTEHPTIRELTSRGFKISVHAYLVHGEVAVCYMAFHPPYRLTLRGRSRSGDVTDAVEGLVHQAESLLIWLPGHLRRPKEPSVHPVATASRAST